MDVLVAVQMGGLQAMVEDFGDLSGQFQSNRIFADCTAKKRRRQLPRRGRQASVFMNQPSDL